MKEEKQEKSRFMLAEYIEKELNAQLEQKGYMIQAGRVPRRHFMEKYGIAD